MVCRTALIALGDLELLPLLLGPKKMKQLIQPFQRYPNDKNLLEKRRHRELMERQEVFFLSFFFRQFRVLISISSTRYVLSILKERQKLSTRTFGI